MQFKSNIFSLVCRQIEVLSENTLNIDIQKLFKLVKQFEEFLFQYFPGNNF